MSKLVREAKYETFTRGQIVFMSVPIFLTLLLVPLIGEDFSAAEQSLFAILANVIVAWIGLTILFSFLKNLTTIQVFDDRVEVLSRFLVKKSRRIEASKIESVDFSESLLGRSKYGVLIVRGAGAAAITLSPIQLPEEVAEAIRGIADKSVSKKGTNSTSGSGLGETQSLAELIRMKEQGHLTDAEFSAAKKKLLG
jgi:uncharacterized membrane protein YdbT with pleckstrin-like domain